MRTGFLLHDVFNFRYCRHCGLIGFAHVTLGIARGVTFELALVKGSNELMDGGFVNIAAGELLTDIVTCELLYRHVQLVADISPQGTQHLVVELAGTTGLHQLVSLLQTLHSYLVGFLATHLADVGIVDGTLTEDDKQRDERQGEQA